MLDRVNENKKINPIKTVQSDQYDTVEVDQSTEVLSEIIDLMQREMRNFLESLQTNPARRKFAVEDSFGSLLNYVKSYDRLLYSTVSNFVYDLLDGSDRNNRIQEQERFDVFLHNFEALVAYANKEQAVIKKWADENNPSSVKQVEDTCKAVL